MPRRAGEGLPWPQESHRLIMPELTCFRLLDAESPAGPLAEAVRQVSAGQAGDKVFILDSKSFKQIEDAPFSYWLSPREFKLFSSTQQLEGPGRNVRQGLATADDFRFVRCMWEVTLVGGDKWLPFAKGGPHSNFYAEHYLRVNWDRDGLEMKSTTGARIQNEAFNLKPGLTWSDRTTKDFSARIWPSGGIFSIKGSAGFFSADNLYLLGLMNSPTFNQLLAAMVGAADMAAKSYQVGTISRVPFLPPAEPEKRQVGLLSLEGWKARRNAFVLQETSNFFTKPFKDLPTNLSSMVKSNAAAVDQSKSEVLRCCSEIDEVIRGLYRLPARKAGPKDDNGVDAPEEDSFTAQITADSEAARLVSYVVGVAFGRWNQGLAMAREVASLPGDPFAPLPSQPPGMAPDGHRNAVLYLAGEAGTALYEPTLRILGELFGGHSAKFEQDAAAALRVEFLAEYLGQPAGFFSDHLAAYSGSRRQAPIYWPLSTKSGNFTIWVYYPKLDDQSLPKLIADVLSPKIRTLSQEIENRRATPGGKIGELEALRQELEEMRTDFLDLINRGYRPNQNDGVLITACPLAKYFRHAGFRKNLEACWKELARGDYDWAHLAMAMWPDRVLEVCKKDRSIAIAHGKEELCPAEPTKATRGRKKNPSSP